MDLNQTKKHLRKLTQKIIKKTKNRLEDLDSSDIIPDYQKKFNLTEDQAFEKLDAILKTLSEDAENIASEYKTFFTSTGINENYDTCPFLTQVWNGDFYGDSELKAFEELFKDLDDKLKILESEESFWEFLQK